MRHNFKKKFGQNFLKNNKYIHKLLEPLELTENDIVVEIGPGDGMVTEQILNSGAKLISIEVDYDLLAKILKRFNNNSNFNLEHNDIIKADLNEVLNKYIKDLDKKEIKVTGSLPYNISKQIIDKLFKEKFVNNVNIKNMSFIVQDEVSKVYAAKAPKATFLSNYSQIFSRVRKLESIPASQFYPKPKVDGGILYFELKEDIDKNWKELAKLIKIGFVSPRKTLYNNIKSSTKYDVEQIVMSMANLNLKTTARASELEFEDWEKLNDSLHLRPQL